MFSYKNQQTGKTTKERKQYFKGLSKKLKKSRLSEKIQGVS